MAARARKIARRKNDTLQTLYSNSKLELTLLLQRFDVDAKHSSSCLHRVGLGVVGEVFRLSL